MSMPRLTQLFERFAKTKTEVNEGWATTNAYLTFDTIEMDSLSKLAITVKNAHVSAAAKYKILGSIDGVSYNEVQAEAELTAGQVGGYNGIIAYKYVIVQAKSSVTDTPATVSTQMYARG